MMPSCLVNKCASHTGKKDQSRAIKLHTFPKDAIRIQTWLLHTGQTFKDLEKLVGLVMEGQKDNKYWICSLHFTSESYINTPSGRVLRPDAVPSIFEGFQQGENVIEETLKKKQSRAKKRPMGYLSSAYSDATTSSQSTETFLQDIDSTEIIVCKIGFCTIGTQTEYTMCNTEIEFCKEDFCTIGTQTEYTLCNSNIKYLSHAEERCKIPILPLTGPAVSTPIAQAGKISLMDNASDASPLHKKAHIKTELYSNEPEDESMDFQGNHFLWKNLKKEITATFQVNPV
ncbi:uncharacterized protein LOC130355743 [Hyla sarda]|uniref:uncharacterized protein LOC130355743 n=1 Tax=Hyla sarda TaxID=327740 RepID=UPI0024C26916|nr:uncharacterized protein LOC130355743 [Hyla sarda]XP_056412295.1 uncharacterized protein LOC130355743 [Hyla sarda]XP_056412296.1 uncharacterized protein LOC130355743 [Hyla sarda]XP_056412297.1 uncharacterized protein LOC130355743 [Hyla sarda]XP_056412298.1 uncharacterized protein LOC130355743 [Hyla sarda]